MLAVTFFLLFFQSNLACFVEFCEHCSVFSENICINCKLGYQIDLSQGCVESNSRKLLIENCEIADNGYCLVCEAGFVLLNFRCYPQCTEDCQCSNLNICESFESLQSPRILRARASSNSSRTIAPAIVGSIIGVLVFILIFCWLRVYYRRYRLRPLQASAVVANPVTFQNGDSIINNSTGIVVIKDEQNLMNSTTLFEHQQLKSEHLDYNQFMAELTPNHLVEISKANFNTTVPLVQLDQNFMVNGEKVCKLCGTEFNPKLDHRIIPCKHVFHGECIYNWLLVKDFKYCPIDRVSFN